MITLTYRIWLWFPAGGLDVARNDKKAADMWSVSAELPEHHKCLEQLGIKSVAFQRDCTGFLIPASMLAQPLVANIACERDFSERQLRATDLPETAADALHGLLRTYANDGWLSITEAGDVLGSSVRTIQRRLASERTTFRAVIERTRGEMAGELLETTDATIKEIAAQLGYGNQGNFTRAFRRWAGVSPRAYRRGQISR